MHVREEARDEVGYRCAVHRKILRSHVGSMQFYLGVFTCVASL